MNRIEIDNDHLIERYLDGRLSETESRRFEAYWIENPDLIRDLERGARLKSGLAGLRESGELPSLMRLKESRRVPLWNGPIECRLFRFDMVAGSARAP